jgi:pSer/pThr/pTyr-binding forkhead associated (FHA) protein
VAHLTLVLQGREVRKFVLNQGVTTIGRAQDNDIVINNLALSRRHAQVERKSARYEVSDLQSQNGVYVNSERVRGSRILNNADTITLGTYHFVFNDTATSDPDVQAVHRPKVEARSKAEPPAVASRPAEREKEEPPEHVPLLVLKYNDVELQRFPLRKQTCLIGRAKDCDVQIAERRLSRKHCEIVHSDGERFFVKDLGSQNGTYVNRKRIRDFYELKHGDILNFAEYSVLYLGDLSEYDGPDLPNARRQAAQGARGDGVGPRVGSDIGAEETEFPEAYNEGFDESNAPSIVPDDDAPLHPSDMTEDPEDSRAERKMPMAMMPSEGEPFTEEPNRARERRKQMRRAVRPERSPAPEKDRRPAQGRGAARNGEPQVRGIDVHPPSKKAPPAAATTGARDPIPHKKLKRISDPAARADELEDVPDENGDVAPDDELQGWYQSRQEKSEIFEEEDSSVLLRGKSSVSQILSTMMVDKRELDRNLSMKAKQRKFFVDVTRGGEKVYNGPLNQQVTVLGTDRDADIQLKGRYVAGRHSILVRVRDSLLLVRLGSSSAARVNGLPKLQAFLKSGDVIQIDETTIKIFEE